MSATQAAERIRALRGTITSFDQLLDELATIIADADETAPDPEVAHTE